jgi:hypothetical protein
MMMAKSGLKIPNRTLCYLKMQLILHHPSYFVLLKTLYVILLRNDSDRWDLHTMHKDI